MKRIWGFFKTVLTLAVEIVPWMLLGWGMLRLGLWAGKIHWALQLVVLWGSLALGNMISLGKKLGAARIREQQQIKRNEEIVKALGNRSATGKLEGLANLRLALYLRPFSTDTRLDIYCPFPIDARFFSIDQLEEDFRSLESVIYEGLRSEYSFIALSNERKAIGLWEDAVKTFDWARAFHSGPAELQAGEDWFELFQELAGAATLIICIPLAGLSTAREVGWLKNSSLLGKTLFIMPNEKSSEWREVAELYKVSGIQLPEYLSDDGMHVRLFTLSEDGATDKLIRVDCGQLEKPRLYLKRLGLQPQAPTPAKRR